MTNPAVETLARLKPFMDQDHVTLVNVCKISEIESLAPSTVLFEIDDIDFYTYYLIEGELELLSKDGRIQTIEAESDAARNPISTLIPRQYTARAVVESKVLKLNTDKLNYTLYGDGHSGQVSNLHVEDNLSETSQFEVEIFSGIVRGVANGNMHMPALPGIVLRILNLINTNDMSFYQLEMTVQHEPEYVQTIIDIANSDFYPTGEDVSNLKDAVAIISYRQVLLWLLAISMKQVFNASTDNMQIQTRNLWLISSFVAAISAILAQKTKLFTPAEAFLCGLVQDIGVLPIYRYLDADSSEPNGNNRVERAVSDLRGEVGAMVLTKWSFPQNCNTVAREVENWSRDNSSKVDITDLVLIAKLHAYLQFHTDKPLPPMFKLPAFKKLGLRSYGPETGLEMLNEAKTMLVDIFKFLD